MQKSMTHWILFDYKKLPKRFSGRSPFSAAFPLPFQITQLIVIGHMCTSGAGVWISA